MPRLLHSSRVTLKKSLADDMKLQLENNYYTCKISPFGSKINPYTDQKEPRWRHTSASLNML